MPNIKFRQDTARTLSYVGRGGKHQCVYWDTALESFGVRVYPSGRRTTEQLSGRPVSKQKVTRST
jgi:hypothetical protein